MNTSTQLKALVRNLSKKTGVEAETLLRNFMMERFWSALLSPATETASYSRVGC